MSTTSSEVMTLMEAQRAYKVGRDTLRSRLALRGYKPAGHAPSKRHCPPGLFLVSDIEDVVYNVADRWKCAEGNEHVEISSERVKCPICGKTDYGSNVRGGWCCRCWCKEYNRRHPIIKDLAELRSAWRKNGQTVGKNEITRGEI